MNYFTTPIVFAVVFIAATVLPAPTPSVTMGTRISRALRRADRKLYDVLRSIRIGGGTSATCWA